MLNCKYEWIVPPLQLVLEEVPLFVVQAKSGWARAGTAFFFLQANQTYKDQCPRAIMTDPQKKYYVRVLIQ